VAGLTTHAYDANWKTWHVLTHESYTQPAGSIVSLNLNKMTKLSLVGSFEPSLNQLYHMRSGKSPNRYMVSPKVRTFEVRRVILHDSGLILQLLTVACVSNCAI
jgi:hypothetical protein